MLSAPQEVIVYGTFAGLFGLCVGSFLNVVIHRLPSGGARSLSGRSHCPRCNAQIRWFDNIPVVSWIVLRARCRDCKTSIPARYPAVELAGGALFLLAWWAAFAKTGEAGYSPLLIFHWIVLSSLLAQSVIDFDLRILPDELTISGMVLGPPAAAVLPELFTDTWSAEILRPIFKNENLTSFVASVGGLAVGAGSIALIRYLGTLWLSRQENFTVTDEGRREISLARFLETLTPRPDALTIEYWLADRCITIRRGRDVKKPGPTEANFALRPGDVVTVRFIREAMGFGDVKLQGAVGAVVGAEGSLLGLAIASFAGAVLGSLNIFRIFVIVKTRAGRRNRTSQQIRIPAYVVAKTAGGTIPFGPYLAIGAAAVLLARAPIIHFLMELWVRDRR